MPNMPIPEVVGVCAQVSKDRWSCVVEIIENLDDAAFLRNEDTSIRREADIGWVGESAKDSYFLKSSWERRGPDA
jgi:hypothetical protein